MKIIVIHSAIETELSNYDLAIKFTITFVIVNSINNKF